MSFLNILLDFESLLLLLMDALDTGMCPMKIGQNSLVTVSDFSLIIKRKVASQWLVSLNWLKVH